MAELLIAIRTGRLDCTRCPVTDALDAEGDVHQDETCAPHACPVAALSALPNLSLWQWFSEILKIESSGIDITSLVLEWPIHILRAFADLRLSLVEQESRLKAQEEGGGIDGHQ